ncbi:hypothetical protein RA280_02755 [Cupriavidus sp. CV2]|uniref:hypothetical protein n=1 Tax=Cupriavidus ulmosensis TaxID=3065913 RepID=UPI00296B483B|nr:hypothetical protein [Cupriavidus sp. CV2]MDW3680683.1 hypothetical protein [Cupriavidus sp. CV2]
MLVASLAQAETRPSGSNAGLGWDQLEPDSFAQIAGEAPSPPPAVVVPGGGDVQAPLIASIGKWSSWGGGTSSASAPPSADNDAPGLSAALRDPVYAEPASRRRQAELFLRLDDVTSATGFVGGRMQSMALALDTVLPRSGGLTIQPRLQLAYQPGLDKSATGFLVGQPADASAAEVVVRVYRTQPTRLTGVGGIYPFVEADLWQDRKQVININGTRIDPDMLRGLLSVNLGAHGSTNGGVKLWVKLKAGRNPGGTLGARYRW